ncbi:hypothetical protein RISK_000083 [Rhodopirellula islandica]|uniref:Uncharacterized protein n=1 Tax=Rhodopirellula islandica TaxID=595434 RepID=A0A0J1ER12_RHOIS|nr:hypothetical protein RISK_000083 [Rhodopirellula islandica]
MGSVKATFKRIAGHHRRGSRQDFRDFVKQVETLDEFRYPDFRF